MMLDRLRILQGRGARIDIRDPVGRIGKDQGGLSQVPAEVVVRGSVEDGLVREEGLDLHGDQVFLAGAQVLRHIQQMGRTAFQDGHGGPVDPDFAGRIQGVQVQERLGEAVHPDPGPEVIVLPCLGSPAMGRRQRDRIPGGIVIPAFLPAFQGRDAFEILLENQLAPIRSSRVLQGETIKGDGFQRCLSGERKTVHSALERHFPQGLSTCGEKEHAPRNVSVEFEFPDVRHGDFGRAAVRMGQADHQVPGRSGERGLHPETPPQRVDGRGRPVSVQDQRTGLDPGSVRRPGRPAAGHVGLLSFLIARRSPRLQGNRPPDGGQRLGLDAGKGGQDIGIPKKRRIQPGIAPEAGSVTGILSQHLHPLRRREPLGFPMEIRHTVRGCVRGEIAHLEGRGRLRGSGDGEAQKGREQQKSLFHGISVSRQNGN